MLLSARMLSDVNNVNSFDYTTNVSWTVGDTTTVYFQLIDASKNIPSSMYQPSPAGLRYMPAAGATLSVTLQSIDDDKTITRAASQPFSQDPSIWALSILATDTLSGTFDLQLALTQSSVVTRGVVNQAVTARPTRRAYC